jgi:hypothetical protein
MRQPRRGLLALIALTLAPVPGRAGDARARFAVKVGVDGTVAGVTGPGAFEARREAGFTGGIAVPIRLGERLALEPELLFAELGLSTDDFGVEARIDSRAVLLPLGLEAYLSRGRARPYLAAGPQLAFIGRALRRLGSVEEDISDEIRDVDVQVFVGAGIDFQVGRGRLGLELRHAWGLRDVDEGLDSTVKLRSFFVLCGYRF